MCGGGGGGEGRRLEINNRDGTEPGNNTTGYSKLSLKRTPFGTDIPGRHQVSVLEGCPS